MLARLGLGGGGSGLLKLVCGGWLAGLLRKGKLVRYTMMEQAMWVRFRPIFFFNELVHPTLKINLGPPRSRWNEIVTAVEKGTLSNNSERRQCHSSSEIFAAAAGKSGIA
jgi:hypothetical protein